MRRQFAPDGRVRVAGVEHEHFACFADVDRRDRLLVVARAGADRDRLSAGATAGYQSADAVQARMPAPCVRHVGGRDLVEFRADGRRSIGLFRDLSHGR